MAFSFGALDLILFGSFGLIFWYGGYLIVQGEMTASNVFMVFAGLMMGQITLSTISPQTMKLSEACTAAYDIYGTIDRQSLIDPRKDCELPDEANTFVLDGDIDFNNVYFRYPSRPSVHVLKDFCLNIPKGKTTALVGPSGCGKSTIVGLIERFYDCEDGFGNVTIGGRDIKSIGITNLRRQIGIVSQEPVLFATSIAQNIAWGLPLKTDSNGNDEKSVSMDEVVAAAKLANAHDFISKLSDGYNTLVGQRGTLLSGGQKQRIAIARALIRKPRIIIFDEATSALDSKSEAEVQEAIDKVSSNCTCIIIAHRLSTIQNADQIVTVSDGHVVEKGTHSELMAIENGIYQGLVKQQQTEEKKEDEKGVKSNETSSKKKKKSDDDDSDDKDDEKKNKKGDDFVMATGERTKEELDAQMREADKGKNKAMFRAFKLLRPNAFYVFIACVCAFLNGGMMPSFAFLLTEIMKVMLYDPNNSSGSVTSSQHDHDLTIWSLAFLFLGIATLITYFVQYTCSSIASERLAHHLRHESFKAMLRQEMGWFDNKENMTGILITHLATDSMLIHSLTSDQMTTIVQSISSIAFGIVVGVIGSWKVALVCLACIPVLLLTSYVNVHVASKYAQRVNVAYEESGRIACEALENVRTVVSIGREKTFLEQFGEQLRRPMRMGLRTNLFQALSSAVEALFQYWLTALAFWYGTKLMMEPDSTVTFTDIMKAEMGMIFGANGVEQVARFFPDYGKTTAAAYSVFKLLDRKPLVPYPDEVKSTIPGKSKDEHNADGKRQLDTVSGLLKFEDVKFSYPTRPDVQVLKGLTFTAKPKQTIALVGESGCGKSTVISLSERLYLPTSGSIKLDDTPIEDLDISWLRSQIGLVSQEPVLFATSIYENIRYGKLDATKEEIEEAAKKANAHNFIMSFPEGYDTPVGEKGVTLSGGQKQRIAIARALVRNPKVLLLDEATSALDSQSEKVVQEALERASEGRTTIVIAHRLSTIQNADVIFVIKDGVIVEEGTHHTLINKPDSLYAALSRAQNGSN